MNAKNLCHKAWEKMDCLVTALNVWHRVLLEQE